MGNVFISYARADAKQAGRLRDDLKQAGHGCWLDTSDILGGEDWVRSISKGIEKSDACLSLPSLL